MHSTFVTDNTLIVKKMNTLLRVLALSLVLSSASCGDGDTKEGEGEGGDLPSLAINDITKFEGNGGTSIFTFLLQLSEPASVDASFTYTAEEGTAGRDIDFLPTAGTVVIPAGTRDASVEVTIIADEFREQDETLLLRLSNPVGLTLARAFATATIRNDDTTIEISEGGYSTPTSYTGYDLIFSDEFDLANINQSYWSYNLGDSGWGNNELQNYTNSARNSYISNGNLIIEAIKESDGTYTSARMLSQDKVEFAFGRVDIRAKLPEGQGIWPALWMLGSNIDEVGWPACGEIDIMELVGHDPDEVHGTAHWGDEGSGFSIFNTATYQDDDAFQDEYHVFSIIWEPNSIKWFVDDFEIHSLTPADVGNQAWRFNHEFFLIMNVAVGGNWPGYPDETTTFPQRMIVDYVRVFQRT